jgi:PAS domain S-box-containing protein
MMMAEKEKKRPRPGKKAAGPAPKVRPQKGSRAAPKKAAAKPSPYFDLYNQVPVGYFTLNEAGLILNANLTTTILLEVTRGALVNQPITRFIFPADHGIYARHRKYLFEKGSSQACELRLLKKDGSPFWVRIEAAAAKDADGEPICRAVISDITDRKRTEMLLQESRARYEAIFESTGTATLLVEEDTTIIMANRECLPVTGYSPEELVGTKWPKYVAPESLELMLKRHQARRKDFGQVPRKYEVKMINKGGLIRDVLMDIAVIPGTKKSVVSMLDVTERKRAEERLADTAAYIRSLIEASQDPLVTIGPDGKITDVNKASELAIGMSRDELIGTEFSGYFTEPDKARSGYERVFAEGSITDYPLSLRHKSGRVMDVLYNATVYKDEAGKVKGVFAAARDVTERKQAEEALLSSQEIIKGIINSIPVRVFWKDKNLVFLGCNEAFARDAGFADPKDIIGKDDYQMGWRDQAELYRGDDRQVISSGCTKLLIEEPQTTPDGNTITLLTSKIPLRDSMGEICGVLGSYVDITERKIMEAKLRETYDRLVLAQAAAGAGFWDWNVATNKLEWSKELFRLFGLDPSRDEATFDMWRHILHPEDREAAEERISAAIRDGAHLESEYRIVWPTGEVRWINALGDTTYDTDGRALRMAGLCLDITERKRAEATVHASLREKEILLREIHHRVKNNMQVISSLFNLQAGQIKDPEAQRMLKEGQLRIRSMALIHEKLYQSHDLSKIDFASYLRSLSTYLFNFFKVDPDKVQLETDLDEVWLDVNSAVPCGLLTSELITNALKHAFPEDRKGVVRIGLRLREDGYVELRVADNGVGFPETVDFRNTVSLGMQIACLLVGQLEATVELDREKGTAFTIVFRELDYGKRT